jgi:hypothetical protein
LTYHQCDIIYLVWNLDQSEQDIAWLNVFQLNVKLGCGKSSIARVMTPISIFKSILSYVCFIWEHWPPSAWVSEPQSIGMHAHPKISLWKVSKPSIHVKFIYFISYFVGSMFIYSKRYIGIFGSSDLRLERPTGSFWQIPLIVNYIGLA